MATLARFITNRVIFLPVPIFFSTEKCRKSLAFKIKCVPLQRNRENGCTAMRK